MLLGDCEQLKSEARLEIRLSENRSGSLLPDLSADEPSSLLRYIDIPNPRLRRPKSLALRGSAEQRAREAGLKRADNAPLFTELLKLTGERSYRLARIRLGKE